MGALVAILQSDPNLLRCQVTRLDAHVALADPDRPPDAYGFGYYGNGSVLLGKRPTGAPHALGLAELVGQLDSEALLVHARQATIGKAKDENTHPFRFRRWLFAHDGTVEAFDRVRPRLLEALPEFLRRNVVGETDSEHVFTWFLKVLRDGGRIDELDLDAGIAARALAETVRQVEAWSREAGAQRPGAKPRSGRRGHRRNSSAGAAIAAITSGATVIEFERVCRRARSLHLVRRFFWNKSLTGRARNLS